MIISRKSPKVVTTNLTGRKKGLDRRILAFWFVRCEDGRFYQLQGRFFLLNFNESN